MINPELLYPSLGRSRAWKCPHIQQKMQAAAFQCFSNAGGTLNVVSFILRVQWPEELHYEVFVVNRSSHPFFCPDLSQL